MVWTTPKTFTAGERLFAQDLNTYVSDNLADLDPRTVKSFADSSARSTAIPSPSTGAVTFLEDTDAVEVYDGSAWVSVAPTPDAPSILQVVYASTNSTTATTGTARADTALTATITPSDAANTVLVIANFQYLSCNNSGSSTVLDIYNGSTNSTVDATRTDTGTDTGHNITYVDSPASASAVTYTVRIRRAGSAATATVAGWQTLVLMEVAA